MTKPDHDDTDSCNALRIVSEGLLEARLKGRVTCGLYESAQALERNQSLRGICILPKDELQCEDSGCLLFMMETFCRENNIPIIKVGDIVKLAECVGLKNTALANGEEFNCILIKTGFTGLRRPRMAHKKIEILERMCYKFAEHGKQFVVDNK